MLQVVVHDTRGGTTISALQRHLQKNIIENSNSQHISIIKEFHHEQHEFRAVCWRYVAAIHCFCQLAKRAHWPVPAPQALYGPATVLRPIYGCTNNASGMVCPVRCFTASGVFCSLYFNVSNASGMVCSSFWCYAPDLLSCQRGFKSPWFSFPSKVRSQ